MSSHFKNYRNTPYHCFLIIVLYYSSFISAQTDTITRGQLIRDGDTIISSNQRFTLGFFSLQNSSSRYVGIWYTSIPTDSHSIVWVANRENPISGNGGTFTIGNDGNLQVLDRSQNTVWSSNETVGSYNSSAILMNTGALVLHETGNMNREFWSTFRYPTDTYLPQMQVRINASDGERQYFRSWRSISDPAPGNYTMGLDTRGSPQIIIWEGQQRRWRSGHWNGLIFTGIPNIRAVYLFGIRLFNEGDGRLYFSYTPANSSDLIKFRMYWDGIERQERWNAGRGAWDVVQSDPVGQCDRYNQCGPFGRCSEVDSPICNCIQGFVPRDTNEWNRGNCSGGCVRRVELQCGENNQESGGFLGVNNVKLPDFVDYVGGENATGCERRCLALGNCSCTGYAFVSGINCMIWYQDLLDVQQFEEGGNTVFVRVARSELGNGDNNRSQVTRTIIISVVTVTTFILCCISIWILWKRRRKSQEILTGNAIPEVGPNGEFLIDDISVDMPQGTGTELAMFSFNDLVVATEDFSNKNKLGQGGFGQVYKGILPGKQEIAVKKLSVVSGQGLEEFKNEITVIAKLQHRNLVRLLGCCAQGEEKMLLYEYMPNKSLDTFLFDSEKKGLLDWNKRFSIIEGIARGLVYLHRDSRLRIIHRDLKASNILLDEDMNPKISDFGMARIFGGNQNEENTMRVVGTYGYMAPEYAMEGLFSIKSDVYSFGVLLLEIVTGRRSISSVSTEDSNIIEYAWDIFNSGKSIELADPSFSDSCSKEQVLRCIHIGMLCVQDNAGYRPNMPVVVLMLESDNMVLPMPKRPTFTSMRHSKEDADMWNGILDASSNNVTISVVLEIVTSRRSISSVSTEDSNIIEYAWDIFNSGKSIELADPSFSDSCSKEQVLRCIHIGMLCVQDNAGYRPNMPVVVLMLESDNMVLPMPKRPTFTSMRHSKEDADMWNGILDASSNNVTISVVLGR